MNGASCAMHARSNAQMQMENSQHHFTASRTCPVWLMCWRLFSWIGTCTLNASCNSIRSRNYRRQCSSAKLRYGAVKTPKLTLVKRREYIFRVLIRTNFNWLITNTAYVDFPLNLTDPDFCSQLVNFSPKKQIYICRWVTEGRETKIKTWLNIKWSA